MTIIRLRTPETLKKVDGSEVWVLSDEGWKCFTGNEFTIQTTLCIGQFDAVCSELQTLRDSLDRKGGQYHTAYQYRRLGNYPVVSTFGDASVAFSMRWCVTNEESPLSGRPFARPPEGEPLPALSEVIREGVQWFLDHPEENKPPETANAADQPEPESPPT